MSLRTSVRLASAIALAALAACSSGGNSAAPTTSVSGHPTATSTARVDDGRLMLGVITPRGGSASELGTSVRDGVQLAVNEINAHGGIRGQQVKTIVRDEGDNAASTQLAVQDLVQLGVDAIVGPTSSTDVLGTLGTAVKAGLLTCSPTASALALDDFPDNNLFIRTVPSDSLEAQALARMVEESGNSQAAVVFLDDAYGRPFAQSIIRGLQADSTGVSRSIGYDGSETSIQRTVTAVAKLHPEVVVVLADSSSGPAIISAIDSGITGNKPTYIVNDAIRRPATQASPFSGDLAQRVIGVSPMAYPTTDFLARLRTVRHDANGLFAVNAYDCVNVIALASLTTSSTRGTDMANAVVAVTSNGTSCDTFASCADATAADRNIDYNGPSEGLSIDSNGNVSNATFDRFGFDSAGRDHTEGVITIGSG